jgi:hypothetical protein
VSDENIDWSFVLFREICETGSGHVYGAALYSEDGLLGTAVSDLVPHDAITFDADANALFAAVRTDRDPPARLTIGGVKYLGEQSAPYDVGNAFRAVQLTSISSSRKNGIWLAESKFGLIAGLFERNGMSSPVRAYTEVIRLAKGLNRT